MYVLFNYLVRVFVVVFCGGRGGGGTKKSWTKGMEGDMPLPED